jgi:serine protease Do
MHHRQTTVWLAWLVIGLLPCAAARAEPATPCELDDLRSLQDTFASLAEQVRPTVVAIRTYHVASRSEGESVVRRSSNQGSGVIIESDGYILTNEHVVADADEIDVILHDGRMVQATLVQTDPRSDMAVIRIDATGLPAAKLGDLERVRPGHWAFAMGNPFGLANDDGTLAFTVGNVTAIGKSLTPELDPLEQRYYGNLIQVSTAINPGNSGGPLFNIDGEAIGICTAMLTHSGVNEGVGFAIPISERTHSVIDTLQRGERVVYGYLGVKIKTPTPVQRQLAGVPDGEGAVVVEVLADDVPAARAGLREGDFIVEFDGVAIRNSDHLVRLVGETPVSRAVRLAYVRDGTRKYTRVHLVERPVLVASKPPPAQVLPRTYDWNGVLLGEPTDKILSANGLSRADAGLVVVALDRASRGYQGGLREGAMIMKYDGQRVRSIEEFAAVDQQASGPITLTLNDGKTVRFRKPK